MTKHVLFADEFIPYRPEGSKVLIIKFRFYFLCVPRGLVVKLGPGASKVLGSIRGRTFSCSLLLFSFLLFFFVFSFSFHFRYNSFVVSIYNF